MIRRILPAALLGILLFAGFRAIGPLPPIGPLLDPANGVWASAAATNFPALQLRQIPGMHDSVTVLFDDRGVPHIFASTEDDAWRALGFVVARDRLFQMEAQTRAASGRLTEWAGDRALEADRESRALGLAWGAERKAAVYDRSSPAWLAMQAYAEGVNAYIAQMRPRDLPLEYRLLKARPIKWKPIHSFYFLARMSLTLGLNDATLRRLRAQSLVGKAAADALFPAGIAADEHYEIEDVALLDAYPVVHPRLDHADRRIAHDLQSGAVVHQPDGYRLQFGIRRAIAMAAEDIGLADPAALQLAVAARDAFHMLGAPEGYLPLAEMTIYLATAPKSNSAKRALDAAMEAAQATPAAPVPLHIRNAPTALMKELGYHAGYRYAHDSPDAYLPQEYLPDELAGRKLYTPGAFGHEKRIAERLEWWERLKRREEPGADGPA